MFSLSLSILHKKKSLPLWSFPDLSQAKWTVLSHLFSHVSGYTSMTTLIPSYYNYYLITPLLLSLSNSNIESILFVIMSLLSLLNILWDTQMNN